MGQLAAQIEALKSEFASARPDGLRAHVARVAEEARDLALRWDADPERVELAVWGHDFFRALPSDEQLRMAEQVGVRVRKADLAAPVILHGPTAAVVLEAEYGITDRDVLDAIAQHTLGAPRMSLIAKILLLADKFEPNKRARTPVMAGIRKLARRDLDLALLCWADSKWVEERSNAWQSHPVHWKSRRRWVRDHHAEIAAELR